MTLHKGFKTRIALLAAVALVIAACGDSPEAQTDQTTTTESISAETTTTVAAETTTTAAETTTTLATLESTSTTGAPSSEAGAALSQAIDQTAELTSARYEGEIRMTGLTDPTGALGDIDEFSMTFSGAYTADGSFSMLMDLSSLAELAGEDLGGFGDFFGAMEIRVIDGVGYMSMPILTMFTGYEWVEFPEDESGEFTQGFTGGTNPTNPSDFLTAMRDANAEVTEIGRELVRGVETTHYSARIDIETLMEDASAEERAEIEAQIGASGVSELPFDVWIGDDGILRRYEFKIDGSEIEQQPEEGEFESMIMIMEMFDIGADVVIEKPPADAIAPEDAFADMLGFADAFGDLEG